MNPDLKFPISIPYKKNTKKDLVSGMKTAGIPLRVFKALDYRFTIHTTPDNDGYVMWLSLSRKVLEFQKEDFLKFYNRAYCDKDHALPGSTSVEELKNILTLGILFRFHKYLSRKVYRRRGKKTQKQLIKELQDRTRAEGLPHLPKDIARQFLIDKGIIVPRNKKNSEAASTSDSCVLGEIYPTENQGCTQ